MAGVITKDPGVCWDLSVVQSPDAGPCFHICGISSDTENRLCVSAPVIWLIVRPGIARPHVRLCRPTIGGEAYVWKADLTPSPMNCKESGFVLYLVLVNYR